MSEFTKYDDIIDTRDIQERIEELYEELDLDSNGEPNEYDEGDEKPEPLDEDERTELEEELRELLEFKAEVEAYSGDSFESGVTLIADSHFQDYAKEYAGDIHGAEVTEAAWPFDNIDWEAAADDLRMDYSEVEWDGYSFWVR
jgi:hypothetical protein